MRRHIMVLGLAVVLAAAAVGAAPARTAAPACKTAGLVVWLGAVGDASAGSNYITLRFTNQSGHTCTLGGYPGVSAVDLAGHPLGSPARRDVSTPRVLRLDDGATATALVRIAFAGNFPPATCHRHAAAALRIYPPDETAAKLVPIAFDACSKPGPVFLSVKALSS
jgi:hypothetical protein